MVDPFTPEERRAWEAVLEASWAIHHIEDRPLGANQEELAGAIHAMQDFVKQHMLHRMWPEAFGDWWKQYKFEDGRLIKDHGQTGN